LEKSMNSPQRHCPRPARFTSYVFVVGAALTIAFPWVAYAARVTPPPVPPDIAVSNEHKAFLAGHAVGTQNYICVPSGSGFSWALFGPQATLFSDDDGQIITHFLSANPDEGGIPRPTWQHSRDTSAVWGRAIVASTDPLFVAPDAIPWLLVQEAGTREGPDGGDRLAGVTYIQRVNTTGGKAPTTGCAQASNVGATALVPYTADYIFYRKR
jgi:Protein of unknown function (DUF3455)